MIRGTTPTITITINADIDMQEAGSVYVTFQQGCKTITKTGNDLTIGEHTISCNFTQEESLQFCEGKTASVQVNWMYTDAMDGITKRAATSVQTIPITRQLLPEVLP